MSPKHKTFVSYYHHDDQKYRNLFDKKFGNVFITKSVEMGDINSNLKTDTIRRKIRDEYLRDSTVTVVLIGKNTWKRKHVDWEISSSIRHTEYNPRSGLLGLLLPTRSDFGEKTFDQYTIPPRLWDNVNCGFAKIYDWNENPSNISQWIDAAFKRKAKILPDNSYQMFVNNRSGDRWY